jgi:hypothetical protein
MCVCLAVIKLIDSLSEKICLAGARSIEMVQLLWFRQTNVPSFSLLTTSNHHKTQKCRSQDKKKHAAPSPSTRHECVCAPPFTLVPTSACPIHMVQLLWSRQTNVPSFSLRRYASPPQNSSRAHEKRHATPSLSARCECVHPSPWSNRSIDRAKMWLASARSTECLEPRDDAACKCRGLEPWLMQANKHNIWSHMPSAAAQTNNISCTIYTCPY